MRLGGILLLYAEALNENNQVELARTQLNRVRARVGLLPVPPGLTQDQMRARIEHEQLMELGFEAERFRFLLRQNRFTAAYLPTLIAHDADFTVFELGKSERLPIPNSEVDLNPGTEQNPGWGGN